MIYAFIILGLWTAGLTYWQWQLAKQLTIIYADIFRRDQIISRLNTVVDNMVIVLRETALREALIKQVATINSPMIVVDSVKEKYTPYLEAMKDYYLRIGRHKPENECWLEMAVLWKEELRAISVPLKLESQACVEVALELVKQDLEKGE